MKRFLTGATLAVALLISGVATTSAPALGGPTAPVSPPATAKTKAHEGVRALKGLPTKAAPSKSKLNALAIVPCSSPCFRYATGKQNHNAADGASITTTIEKPALLTTDYHTLFEIAVNDQTTNNTIEVGWTVDRSVNNGSADPHMFTFMWDAGNSQCYNGCAPGTGAQYLDAVGCSPWCAGDNLASFIGTSHTFTIQHYSTGTAGWWISVDGTFRGVWPDTQFTTVSTTADFTQVFGEVALGNTPSQTDMGTGVLASSSAGATASNFTLHNSTSSPSLSVNVVGTEPTRWNWASTSSTSFNYGGPGGNEDIQSCSGVGAQSTFGFGASPYNGGYGALCLYGNTSGGVPVTQIYNKDGSSPRNTCFPNLGTLDGQTTSPIRTMVNTTYVKWHWFRDASCAGANTLLDYGQANLPVGWTALTHASLMRSSTLNSH